MPGRIPFARVLLKTRDYCSGLAWPEHLQSASLRPRAHQRDSRALPSLSEVRRSSSHHLPRPFRHFFHVITFHQPSPNPGRQPIVNFLSLVAPCHPLYLDEVTLRLRHRRPNPHSRDRFPRSGTSPPRGRPRFWRWSRTPQFCDPGCAARSCHLLRPATRRFNA